MLAALAALVWMSGCSDKDPVSAQNEGTDSPAGKLVVTKTKAGRGLGAGGPVGTMRKITAKLSGGAYMKFVLIDPGTFTMGSPASEPGHDNDESPQHQVTLTKGFYLGQYEITQGQWEAVMGTRPWEGQDHVPTFMGSDGFVRPAPNAPDHAATYISWDDLQPFIHRLNVAAGDSLYRLPTEAEWEYACRAGTTTQWSFGDDGSQLGNYAWYWDNAWGLYDTYAHPVGTKLPNPWGLYDMYGNVEELMQDGWDEPYSSEAQTNPQGPVNDNGTRIRRGGSLLELAVGTDAPDSADRVGVDQNQRWPSLGARLVRIK